MALAEEQARPVVAGRGRMWVGWAVVVAAAVLIALSFAYVSDSAPAEPGERQRVASVSVAEVTVGPMTVRSRYPGELDADTADVAAFYAGRLVAVHVRVGDTVAKGDVLAEIDPVDAREQVAAAAAQAKAASAEQKRARVEHAAAAAETARMEELARRQIISELEIENLRARAASLAAAADAAAAGEIEARARVRLLEKRLVETRVRAPFAGRVAARYADAGAVVASGTRLVRIVASSPLWVRFDIPESDVIGVGPGTRLRVTTAAGGREPRRDEGADPATSVVAEVTGVASEVDRAQRTVAVEARLESPPPLWLPGMFAEVTVERGGLEKATLVPSAAVMSRLQPSGAVETGIFLAADDKARWRAVTVRAREGDRVALAETLDAGAKVLVAGHADLADGAKIEIVGASAP